MKWLVALGLAFTFEIITSKCIKLFIVHFLVEILIMIIIFL